VESEKKRFFSRVTMGPAAKIRSIGEITHPEGLLSSKIMLKS
jgi:hypothetical protein